MDVIRIHIFKKFNFHIIIVYLFYTSTPAVVHIYIDTTQDNFHSRIRNYIDTSLQKHPDVIPVVML